MAEVKYGVKNGDCVLGLMWDLGGGREVFSTYENKVDLNHSLQIIDTEGNEIKEVEVLEMISEILPRVNE